MALTRSVVSKIILFDIEFFMYLHFSVCMNTCHLKLIYIYFFAMQISGQRALALHLIASVLNKAIFGICQNQFASTLNYTGTNGCIDWEAIWAFALGPEPELALALR